MERVYIRGAGQLPVVRSTAQPIRALAASSLRAAMSDAGIERVDALYVGNMMSGRLSNQAQLGALVADEAGLRGIEAATTEAACSSGAVALRFGMMAVRSGLAGLVAVCGVELMTQASRDDVTIALATASDWEIEGGCGETFVTLNARLMRLYAEHYRRDYDEFGQFAVEAHRNGNQNPNALFRDKQVSIEGYLESRLISPPLRLLDASAICSGAATVILGSRAALEASRAAAHDRRVRVIGSAIGTDSLSLQRRRDVLFLDGVARSVDGALTMAGIGLDEIDLFEAHDAYTIMSVMSLEATGFAQPGRGLDFARDNGIGRDGALPMATMGGLKARGHPVGATGVYQAAECFLQLTNRAGANQIPNAEVAMAQNFGGTGATVVTHLFRAEA
ncbi:MAG: hypothetical protein KC609_07495 [Myxococcales bacterium]|nr:hypothetical protein [Myxococcales bacterium]